MNKQKKRWGIFATPVGTNVLQPFWIFVGSSLERHINGASIFASKKDAISNMDNLKLAPYNVAVWSYEVKELPHGK